MPNPGSKKSSSREMSFSQFILPFGTTVSVVLTLFFAAGIGYFYQQSRVYADSVKANNVRISELEGLQQQAKDSLNTYQRQRRDLEKVLFTDTDIPSFLKGIYTKSRKFSIIIEELKTLRAKEIRVEQKTSRAKSNGEGLEPIYVLASSPFTVTLSGSFRDILFFLISLEKQEKLFVINGLSLRESRFPDLECRLGFELLSLEKNV